MAALLLVRPTTVSRAGTQDGGEPSMLQVVGVSQPKRQSLETQYSRVRNLSKVHGSRLLGAMRTLVGKRYAALWRWRCLAWCQGCTKANFAPTVGLRGVS